MVKSFHEIEIILKNIFMQNDFHCFLHNIIFDKTDEIHIHELVSFLCNYFIMCLINGYFLAMSEKFLIS